jgi:hypothetical protein
MRADADFAAATAQGIDRSDASEEVARWMRELAQRRVPQAVPRRRHVRSRARVALVQKTGARWKRAEPMVLLALLAFAFLEYFYADVMHTILSLPALIFFVFPS